MACSAVLLLWKEFCELHINPVPGIIIDEESVVKNIYEWVVKIKGSSETIYEGETFQLQFKFGSKYPFDSPIVVFIGDNIPLHPHVYSNGHIGLNILYQDWSPALSVEAICLSIISMLSSATKKERPNGDLNYIRNCSNNPKKEKWYFFDDNV